MRSSSEMRSGGLVVFTLATIGLILAAGHSVAGVERASSASGRAPDGMAVTSRSLSRVSGTGRDPRALRVKALNAAGRATTADGYLLGIDPSDFDVLRHAGGVLSLRYPSASARRKSGLKACARILYRLRWESSSKDPEERAQELLPRASFAGTSFEVAGGASELTPGGPKRKIAWRYIDPIAEKSGDSYEVHGVAVAQLPRPGHGHTMPVGLLILTLDGRKTRSGEGCGPSSYTVGPNVELPIVLFS